MILRSTKAIVLCTALLLLCSAVPSRDIDDMTGMVLEYIHSSRPELSVQGDVLFVSVDEQRMYRIRAGELISEHIISTARNGTGSKLNSFCTPLGLHRISEKIGRDVPAWGVLKDRRFTGEIAWEDEEDLTDVITSRILRLEGLEPGLNKGRGIDSWSRAIYIHGTADEDHLGTPSSNGCVRLGNRDIIALFDELPVGTLVVIL